MTVVDAPAPVLSAHQTPWHVGAVTLTVHDLKTVLAFYRDAIGLAVIDETGGKATLGAGGVPLLNLVEDANARRRSPREAGLFHTAFLVPSRADLADWVRHAMRIKLPMEGASDHLVSEALYLSDPEDNGIEIYADRAKGDWTWQADGVAMSTERLNIAGLLEEGIDRPFQGMAAGTRVGHIHLQVGDIATAERFYHEVLGLDVTARRNGGTFYSTGRYHHHVATNVWQSRGAGPRDLPSTGLSGFEWVAADAATFAKLRERLQEAETPFSVDGGTIKLADPWRNTVVLTVAG